MMSKQRIQDITFTVVFKWGLKTFYQMFLLSVQLSGRMKQREEVSGRLGEIKNRIVSAVNHLPTRCVLCYSSTVYNDMSVCSRFELW